MKHKRLASKILGRIWTETSRNLDLGRVYELSPVIAAPPALSYVGERLSLMWLI